MGLSYVGGSWARAPSVAFGVITLFAFACGTSSPTGTFLDGGASSGGSGGSDALSACGAYYDAIYGGGCNAPTLPANELARQRARYVTYCESLLALPDSNLTAEALASCAQQVHTTDACRFADGATALCALNTTGTRAADASCSAGSQCESGVCAFPGGSAASACGACTSFVPLGQPCSGNTCVATADCVGSPPVCTAVTFGASAGSTCGETTACAPGLYCSASSVCTAVESEGAACTDDAQCAAQLYCVSGECQPPGAVGAACPGGDSCDYALLCPNTTKQCTTVGWASAGQPCGASVLCLVGDCQTNVCPQVIADGQPCTGKDLEPICDAFANCTNGTCALTVSSACQ
jgi:hypothetical protein